MLKILIADDVAIVRHGVKQILLEGFPHALIEESSDCNELVAKSREQDWDIIISDLSMPGGGGMKAMQEIRKEKPLLPILFLSINAEDHYALMVLKAGAHGYLCKDIAPQELIDAVKQLISGRKYITELTAEKISDKLNHSGIVMHEFLNEKEMEVFRLIAAGRDLSEIGELLSIEPAVADDFRNGIFKKMNLSNNDELTRYSKHYKLT